MTIPIQTLGGVTFDYNPTKMTPPESDMSIAVLPTYTGSAIFSWGEILQGKQITLEWDGLSETNYQALRTLYLANEVILWDLGITVGGGRSFNVMILSFTGDYIEHLILYDAPYRINCKMVLDIRSKVS